MSAPEQVLAFASLGGVKNPYFSGDEIVRFNSAYISWRAQQAKQRLRGQRYHKQSTERGAAQPEVKER